MIEAIPTLEGDAAAAVDYRGGHLQIIASAGSGKTEVVAQRVASLLKEGRCPDGNRGAGQAQGGPPRLTIVDYKTAADNHASHDFQLQVYTDAGRREGLEVDRAFVHDLREGKRFSVPVDEPQVKTAEDLVRELVKGMRQRQYVPKPGKVCSRCDVKPICKHRAG